MQYPQIFPQTSRKPYSHDPVTSISLSRFCLKAKLEEKHGANIVDEARQWHGRIMTEVAGSSVSW